jgi:predicted anti-sigma-YlaC factor YlaD
MNCREFHDLLQQSLDREPIADSADVIAHLAACSDCRALYAAWVGFEIGMRLQPIPVPPADLTDRIVVGVLNQQRAERRRRYTIRAVVALAAAVLFGVLVGVWANRRDKERPSSQPDQVVEKRPEPEALTAGPSLRESMAEVAQLTLRHADETVRTLLPDSAPAEPGPSPLTTSAASLREASNGVSTALEPITDSAKRAFNLFLREIPPVRAEDKRGS